MPKVRPNQIFPGLTSDGTNLTIPLANLPKLDAADANPTTGDAADLLWALIDAAFEANQALAPEARSATFTLAKAAQTAVAGNADARAQPYTFTVRLVPTGLTTVPDA